MENSSPRLRDLILYFLKLGATGFGGPVALVSYMHRDLVQRRSWLKEAEYKRGLAWAQMVPGPLATQVAIYIGYIKGKVLGATLCGLAFVAVPFALVVVLAHMYQRFGGLSWIQGLLYGACAAIVSLTAKSAYELARGTLQGKLLWAIFAVSFLMTAIFERESFWVFVISGMLVWWAWRRIQPGGKEVFNFAAAATAPLAAAPVVLAPSPASLFWFFAKTGALVFGSGLVILPFLHGGLVRDYGWLNERQFLDAVAVGMLTPGPALIAVGFIGYLIAGFPGAVVSTLGIFFPVYLFVILPASRIERYAESKQLNAFVNGVTAAATGALAGAVVMLARRSIVDWPTVVIAAVSLAVFLKTKISEPIVLLAAAAAGWLITGS